MTMIIRRADFTDPRLPAFLAAHHSDLAPQSPPESQHAWGIEALKRPGVRLWVGQSADQLAATCALAPLEPGHEELKSMRTHPGCAGEVTHRGAGARHRGCIEAGYHANLA